MTRTTRWRVLLWALAAATGCAPSFGRLDGVLVDVQPEARPVTAGEAGRVEITREGKQETGQPGSAVKKGDVILTAADGIGVMTLADGYQVIMDPGTDLTIENPSIFVRVGRIIVKKIKEIKEALTVKTELGAAVVQGTEFVFEVNRRQQVLLTVLDGRVTMMPRGGARWQDTVTYVAGERGSFDAARISRMPPLSRLAIDSLRRRIDHVSSMVWPIVPDLRRLPEAEARAELERHGLKATVNPVITRGDRGGPEVGTVVAMRPEPGTRTKQGARVRLDVEERSVAVPNVLGKSLGEALQVLQGAGLRLGDTTGVVQPNGVEGTVSGMAPSPGAYVRPGTTIALSIVHVPVITRTVMCTVPDLRRMTEPQAAQALTNAKLVKGQVTVNSGRTISDQNPVAGASVPCGTAVSYTIGVRIGD